MAPEIHLNIPYHADKVDIFAAGVILFNLVMGSTPFSCATANDKLYRLLASNKTAEFWKHHTDTRKAQGGEDLSNEFMNLVECD